MRELKTHKRKHVIFKLSAKTGCGIIVTGRDASPLWKKVTCKNCLRKKPK